MSIKKFIYLFLIMVCSISCSKNNIQESTLNQKNLELQVIETYNKGVDSLESGDALFAAKKFNQVEILFPQSVWAPKSALMAAYAYYTQDYYGDSIAELERFVRVYSNHKDIDYAYYLLALCHYEQIVDEKKDTQSIIKAKETFNFVIKNFPNSKYALDSQFKLDLVEETLASKEMYIGRYYFNREKWIAAINRFRTVVDDYDTTIYVEEALHRLVEVYYTIGLVDEAKKYANLLGYNYQSSEWYENSYKVFNKLYKTKKIKREKKYSILKKFKSLVD